jgi:hypothetical protein
VVLSRRGPSTRNGKVTEVRVLVVLNPSRPTGKLRQSALRGEAPICRLADLPLQEGPAFLGRGGKWRFSAAAAGEQTNKTRS